MSTITGGHLLYLYKCKKKDVGLLNFWWVFDIYL